MDQVEHECGLRMTTQMAPPMHYAWTSHETLQNLKENSDGGIPKFTGIKFYLKNEGSKYRSSYISCILEFVKWDSDPPKKHSLVNKVSWNLFRSSWKTPVAQRSKPSVKNFTGCELTQSWLDEVLQGSTRGLKTCPITISGSRREFCLRRWKGWRVLITPQ